MIAVVKDRPKLKNYVSALEKIHALADSCGRQLTGWEGALDKLPFEGPRHLTNENRVRRESVQKAKEFRVNFLKNLKPTHPLYHTDEAREARGEPVQD